MISRERFICYHQNFRKYDVLGYYDVLILENRHGGSKFLIERVHYDTSCTNFHPFIGLSLPKETLEI